MAARSGEWAQHFSNASCLKNRDHNYVLPQCKLKMMPFLFAIITTCTCHPHACFIQVCCMNLRKYDEDDDDDDLVISTATVLVSQVEAIVRSLTNMANADANGYLKSNNMLNINNRRTKHYKYSYIYVRTFTKTEPVSLSNPTMQQCLLVKPVDGFKGICCSNWA